MDLSKTKSSLGGDMARDSGIDLSLTSPTSDILLRPSQEDAGAVVNTKKYTSSETMRVSQRHNEDLEYNLGMGTLLKSMDTLMEKAEEVGCESQNMLMRITEMNLSCKNLLNSLEDESENSINDSAEFKERSPVTSNSLVSQQSTDTSPSPSLSQTSVQSLTAVNEENVSTPIQKSPSVCSTNRSKVMDPVLNAINIQKMLDAENTQTESATFMTQVPIPKVQLHIDQKAIPEFCSKRSKRSKRSMTEEKPKWNSTTKVNLSTELPPIKRKDKKEKRPRDATDQKLDMKTIKTLFRDQLQSDSEISHPPVTTSHSSPRRHNDKKTLVDQKQKEVMPSSPIYAENLTGGQLLNSLEPGRLYPTCISSVADEKPTSRIPGTRSAKLQKNVANDALKHLPPVVTKIGMGRPSYTSQRTGRRRSDNQEYDFCVSGINAGKDGAPSSHVLPPIASKSGRPLTPYKNQSHSRTETCTQIPTLPPISSNEVRQEYREPKVFDTWNPKDAVTHHSQNNGPLKKVSKNDGKKSYQKLLSSRPMCHRYI